MKFWIIRWLITLHLASVKIVFHSTLFVLLTCRAIACASNAVKTATVSLYGDEGYVLM